MAERRLLTQFYRTPAGVEPVRDFLRALPSGARAKCGGYMNELEWKGLSLPASHLKKITGSIWELRPEYEGIEYRLFFGVKDGEAVYVHAVIKKQQRAARGDIALAQRRFDEWKVE
ncbi:MAG: type II toxin-antitoxin system RelE/ParE family toxin [Thermomicrobia bacterium]|nr:type II toxin-antitoxin system RelE/ParE family toxin [Thermomicrobia bacterium]